jgi:hypothetical protein
MQLRRKMAGLLAGVSLVVGGLLATAPGAQAAAAADRAASDTAVTAPSAPASTQAKVDVRATSPSISPAAERIRYVPDGESYSCSYGRLCARVWDPTRNTYKVFDLYACHTYSLAHWGGGGDGGGFYNNQTTGTVASFYNSAGTVVYNSTAYDFAPGDWTWDPIWKIKNC